MAFHLKMILQANRFALQMFYRMFCFVNLSPENDSCPLFHLKSWILVHRLFHFALLCASQTQPSARCLCRIKITLSRSLPNTRTRGYFKGTTNFTMNQELEVASNKAECNRKRESRTVVTGGEWRAGEGRTGLG